MNQHSQPLRFDPDRPARRETGSRAQVRVRRALPSDASALQQFYAELSDVSRHFRFCGGTRGITAIQSSEFCTPDHIHREGFVAVVHSMPPEHERIVGHVCLEPIDSATAEVAIAVADEYQRHGIGRQLMASALDWVRSVGIRRIIATTLTANAGIHRLLASLGVARSFRLTSPDTELVTIDVTAGALPTAA